jgi:2-(1,2-epoxy-1,2-dihydrophenyl)acetyl-CoA isomerase
VNNSVSAENSQPEFIAEVRDGIAYATVNRPHARNAMTSAMFEALFELLARIGDDRSVRVVLLKAVGQNFIAGGDVKAFAAGLDLTPDERAKDMRSRAARAGRIATAIARLPQPVIVAARGYVVGAGLSILTAADLAVVSDTAKFMLSHVGLGLSPDGAASFFLPRHVGLKRAAQIAFLGDAIDAEEAATMGLVNWVVPDAGLEQRAEVLAQRLAAGPAVATAEIKSLLGKTFGRSLDQQIAAENDALEKCALTQDYAEGLRAIQERRKPRFGGKA